MTSARKAPAFVTPAATVTLTVTVALRLGLGQNAREHFRVRARRVKREREAVFAALYAEFGPAGQRFVREFAEARRSPLTVVLTRIGGRGVDPTVNLPASLKAVEDHVSEWCGIDDGSPLWRCSCRQEPGPAWGVRIEIHAERGTT